MRKANLDKTTMISNDHRKPWAFLVSIVIFVGLLTIGLFLTYKHILVASILEDRGVAIRPSAYVALFILWAFILLVAVFVKNAVIKYYTMIELDLDRRCISTKEDSNSHKDQTKKSS